MKETVKINLGGRLFDLDNDAFDMLKSYLDSLKKYFNASSDETEEILEGIEERMAELLTARLSSSKKVVTSEDIEFLIQTMGTAEQMDSDKETSKEGSSPGSGKKYESQAKKTRRLYRDADNSIIGGVGSGIGAYLDIDPIWIRLAFIAFIFLNGIGLIVYLVLWAVIPLARTTGQKLEMRGKAVTVDNIEKEVKKEFGKVKDNFKNIRKSEGYQQTRNAISDVLELLGKILLVSVKVIGAIIGIALLISLIFIIIGFFSRFAFHFPFGSVFNRIIHLPHMIFGFTDFNLFTVCLFLLVFIPLLALVIGFFRLLFGSRSKNRVLGSFAGTLWILALITAITLILVDKEDIKLRQTSRFEYQMDYDLHKVLYLNVYEFEGSEIEHYQIFNRQYAYDGSSNRMLRKPKFVIKKASDDDFLIIVDKEFSALSSRDEYMMGRKISDYDWNLNDSVLRLDEYFTVRKNYGWRMPSTEVVLMIPEGQEVFFDRKFARMLDYADTQNHYEYDDLTGKRLIMRSDGLVMAN